MATINDFTPTKTNNDEGKHTLSVNAVLDWLIRKFGNPSADGSVIDGSGLPTFTQRRTDVGNTNQIIESTLLGVKVKGLYVDNPNASDVWIRLFGELPVVGTTLPVSCFRVPAIGSLFIFLESNYLMNASSGLWYTITTSNDDSISNAPLNDCEVKMYGDFI